MEAAHIHAEADGGSNDDENGIPLCFDCHQEIGAYDNKHPRGNKFTPFELKSRRDKLYSLVDSGSVQAQIIAQRIHTAHPSGSSLVPLVDVNTAIGDEKHEPSREAENVLSQAKTQWNAAQTLPRKLQLLSGRDRAYVLDQLLLAFEEDLASKSLIRVITSGLSGQEATVLAEQLLRKVTLLGSVATKARVLGMLPSDRLSAIDRGLRIAFFEEIIEIMRHDQFEEVNVITPAVTKVHDAIPPELHGEYMKALFAQAESSAFQGAPAARQALSSLPDQLVLAGLAALDDSTLGRFAFNGEHVRKFVRDYEPLWPSGRHDVFKEFTTLSPMHFWRKHWKE